MSDSPTGPKSVSSTSPLASPIPVSPSKRQRDINVGSKKFLLRKEEDL